MADEELLAKMLEDWRRAKIVFAQGIVLGILICFVVGLIL